MATLKKAHNELFRRTPDEAYESFDDLYDHCSKQRLQSEDLWERPQDLTLTHDMTVCAGDGKLWQCASSHFNEQTTC